MNEYITVNQMKTLSELSTNFGHGLAQMLELAGYHLARFTTHRFPPHTHKKVLIVCGKGNTGGSGFIAAKHLYNAGHEVSLFLPTKDVANDLNQKNYDLLKRLSLVEQPAIDTKQGDVILDCFIGTGINGDIHDEDIHTIKRINESGKPIISFDVPSGMNADTGKYSQFTVRPDHTVCVGAIKKGVADNSAAGVAHVYDIGIPRHLYQEVGVSYPF